MTWQPTQQTIDYSALVDNLFGFIAAHQADALLWANDNQPLPPFAEFHRSAAGRLATIFPCLLVVNKDVATDFSGDLMDGALRVTLEAMIEGGDSDKLVQNAEKYALAIESLIANCPTKVWVEDSQIDLTTTINALETQFDVLRGDGSAFLQVFQTRFILIVNGASYE